MSRTLPLQVDPHSTPNPIPATAPAPGPALAGEVRVFDPAMCCPTGICGPGVDPAILQVARDLRWLEARGVHVERHNLAQAPEAFVRDPRVAAILESSGDRALPVTLVNGSVLAQGRYPSREELVAALAEA